MRYTVFQKNIICAAGVALAAVFWYAPAVPEARALIETAFTDQASNITETTAQLNGYANVSGDEGAEVWFEYGEGSTFNKTTLRRAFWNKAQTVGEQVIYLASGTTYQARIVARDTTGTYRGEAVSFTTKTSVPKLPYVSTSFAQNVTKSSAILRGQVDPYGDASTEVWFEWGTAVPLSHETVRLPQDGTNQNVVYPLSGLSDDTTYYFRVVARNAKGIAYGDIQGFDTGKALEEGEKDEPDVTTTNPTVIDNGTVVVWNGYVNTKGVSTQTWFEWGKTSSLGNVTPRSLARTDSGTFSEARAGLEQGIVYYYRAVATNKNGTAYGNIKTVTLGEPSSATSPAVQTVSKPMATTGEAETPSPTNILLRGSATSGGGGTLVWFEWGTTSSLGRATAGQALGSVPSRSVSASIFDASSGETYYYRLAAQNETGLSYGGIRSVTAPRVVQASEKPVTTPHPEAPMPEKPARPLAASAFFGTDIFGPYVPEWVLLIFLAFAAVRMIFKKD